jgi:hypothetical protein
MYVPVHKYGTLLNYYSYCLIAIISDCVSWTVLKPLFWADIQRRGSILTWIVILSVYGADTMAEVRLLVSPFLR